MDLSNVKHLDQLVTAVAALGRRVEALEQQAKADGPADDHTGAPKKAAPAKAEPAKAAPRRSTD